MRALPAQHPGRERYAIVRGSVAVMVNDAHGAAEGHGRVVTRRCDEINVPRRWSARLPDFVGRRDAYQPLRVALAFGQRLEPWIEPFGTPQAGRLPYRRCALRLLYAALIPR